MLPTDKNGTIVVSALRARANFGSRSLVVEERGILAPHLIP